jgi:alkaline phosphatase D
MRSFLRLAYLPVLIFFATLPATAQLVSGPMLGPVELRTAKLWIEVKPGSSADLWVWKKGQPTTAKRMTKKQQLINGLRRWYLMW